MWTVKFDTSNSSIVSSSLVSIGDPVLIPSTNKPVKILPFLINYLKKSLSLTYCYNLNCETVALIITLTFSIDKTSTCPIPKYYLKTLNFVPNNKRYL